MTKARIAVLGASGFAGAELLRRLVMHPAAEVVRVCADDHLGEPVASAHPHLEGRTELTFEKLEPAAVSKDVDFILMGLPPQPSFDVVRSTAGTGVRILDMSGAFRLRSAALFERFYGFAHPMPELLGEFVYGLPELSRREIGQARYVASPGCFATTITLGLLPFARAGLLTGPVHTVAITGSSGAGKVPLPTTHHPVREGNVRTYRPLAHPHAPEVQETLSRAGASDPRIDFIPVAGPYVRGIFATSFFTLPRAVDDSELASVIESAYGGEPFVRSPNGRLPEVVAVAGSCFAEVGYARARSEAVERSTDRSVTVFSALDNLIKGGAGQAVQNLNLMLGIDETTALGDPGPYP